MTPFHITGPAIISVSGGRTSGYMLWRILQAHGGTLPADVHAVFANTGREMPGTLDFVQQIASQWGVHIQWIEYRHKPGRAWAEEVSHNNASRAGEPFAAFLHARSALPNPVQRSCTTELKIRTIKRWVMATHGWKHWTNIVGLRADEPRRVAKSAKPTRDRFTRSTPLATAGITVRDVAEFWRGQPFELRLKGHWEGNCDGCFLKGRAAILRMAHDYPERMAWWAEMEAIPRGTKGINRRFRKDRDDYAALNYAGQNQLVGYDETMIEGGEPCDAMCGA